MAPNSLDLQDDQRFALMKFRRSVHDILKPHHDDAFLLRWLRARSWNAEAAEKMLRDSMKWREQWGVDTTLKEWQAPEVLIKYYPSGQAGYDKDGAPVIILPFAGLDLWGLLHTVTKADIIKQTIITLEYYLEEARKQKTNQVTVIIDMEGFQLRQYAWRPAGELVIHLIQMYEMNYPEILKQCFIVNVPSVFALAFSIVKKFLNEYTLSKIQIYKDRRRWLPLIQEKIEADKLPEYYGGTMVDPDGNIRCPSKIKLGGKVPKSLFKNNQVDKIANFENQEYKTTIIKKGKQLTLDFIVAEENCVLKWDFRTEDHDIRFGVSYRQPDSEKLHIEIPYTRVTSQHVSEIGVLLCKYPATYTFTFDNTYSYLRSKKVHYNVGLTIPLDKLNLDTSPDDTIEVAEDALIENN